MWKMFGEIKPAKKRHTHTIMYLSINFLCWNNWPICNFNLLLWHNRTGECAPLKKITFSRTHPFLHPEKCNSVYMKKKQLYFFLLLIHFSQVFIRFCPLHRAFLIIPKILLFWHLVMIPSKLNSFHLHQWQEIKNSFYCFSTPHESGSLVIWHHLLHFILT